MSLVAVTGASGHVGANLVRELIRQGRKVRALVREDTRAIDGLDIEKVKADLLDSGSLKKAFQGAEIVYHLAAHISISKSENRYLNDINITGTKNVLEACRYCNVRRLVHFSSIHAISGDNTEKDIDENTPLVKENRGMKYDYSKVQSELAVLKAVNAGLDAVIVNPTGIIGPYDFKPSFTGRMLKLIVTNRLIAVVNGGFNWVDVRDVADGAIAAETQGKKGERYILGGSWHTLKELSEIMEKIAGVHCRKKAVPMWLARIGAPFAGIFAGLTGEKPLYTSESLFALRHHRNISIQKAIHELGYQPRPIEETIKDTIEWFKSSRRLS